MTPELQKTIADALLELSTDAHKEFLDASVQMNRVASPSSPGEQRGRAERRLERASERHQQSVHLVTGFASLMNAPGITRLSDVKEHIPPIYDTDLVTDELMEALASARKMFDRKAWQHLVNNEGATHPLLVEPSMRLDGDASELYYVDPPGLPYIPGAIMVEAEWSGPPYPVDKPGSPLLSQLNISIQLYTGSRGVIVGKDDLTEATRRYRCSDFEYVKGKAFWFLDRPYTEVGVLPAGRALYAAVSTSGLSPETKLKSLRLTVVKRCTPRLASLYADANRSPPISER